VFDLPELQDVERLCRKNSGKEVSTLNGNNLLVNEEPYFDKRPLPLKQKGHGSSGVARQFCTQCRTMKLVFSHFPNTYIEILEFKF